MHPAIPVLALHHARHMGAPARARRGAFTARVRSRVRVRPARQCRCWRSAAAGSSGTPDRVPVDRTLPSAERSSAAETSAASRISSRPDSCACDFGMSSLVAGLARFDPRVEGVLKTQPGGDLPHLLDSLKRGRAAEPRNTTQVSPRRTALGRPLRVGSPGDRLAVGVCVGAKVRTYRDADRRVRHANDRHEGQGSVRGRTTKSRNRPVAGARTSQVMPRKQPVATRPRSRSTSQVWNQFEG